MVAGIDKKKKEGHLDTKFCYCKWMLFEAAKESKKKRKLWKEIVRDGVLVLILVVNLYIFSFILKFQPPDIYSEIYSAPNY